MKKIFVILAFLLLLTIPTYANEVNILFEHIEEQQISRGITHQRILMMTERGMLDVHTLTINLADPYIELAPVTSPGNLGRREATSHMLRSAGAVAGINADFFGLAGTYSTHFGPLVHGGQLLAASTYTNHTYDEFATFFVGPGGFPFMDYIQSVVRFYNNGRANIDISTYNSIGHSLYWPVVISRAAMYNTADLNRRFDGLVKLVVDGNMLTHITQPGEAVDVPLHGYVVVLPARMAYRTRYFAVGDITLLQRANNLGINVAELQMAIGGGAMILENGVATEGRGVAPNARHPRSAVGVSRDGRTVILMTVDGRSHSIGATHEEMAYLLRRAGAHNAMHFDGGGSTTLVTSDRGENLRVANTVADGSERRVINALGVFDRSTMGTVVTIHAEANVSRATVGIPAQITVYGEDALWNRRALTGATATVDASAGTWANGQYTPLRPGRHVINFAYGGHSAAKVIYASEIAELVPTRSAVHIFEGQRTDITFTGLGWDGATLPVPNMEHRRVSPATLGHFEGDTFVATGAGAGYIAARVGGAAAFLPIYVSGFARPVNMFGATITSDRYSTGIAMQSGGRNLIRLEYELARSTSPQTPRIYFDRPLALPGEPNGLRINVYGDSAGHSIRARVVDANGTGHTVIFGAANHQGWESMIGRLPNAPAPFTVEQIFVHVASWYEISAHTVMFADLEALYAPTDEVTVPTGDRFVDALHREFDGGMVFAVPYVVDNYTATQRGGFAVLNMAATGGGIFSADSGQWQQFTRDALRLDGHLLILMDANPVTFRQRMEFELLHLALLDLQAPTRQIFVVSATATGAEVLTMRDGIRYINLPRPGAQELREIRFLMEDGEVTGWRQEGGMTLEQKIAALAVKMK